MLMATTLSGAALIDAAILVIAANEGIKPQTREHFMALKAKNVKNIIVVQNKIDLISKQKAIVSYKEIKDFLKNNEIPIIPASAQQNVNINKILKALAESPLPERKKDSFPIFMIARSFDINRPGKIPKELNGAVLGGSLRQGTLKVGDEIEIKPGRTSTESGVKTFHPIKTKITGLYKGSNKVDTLTPGGSMSIETQLDMSLGKGDLLSGNVLSHVGKLPNPSNKVVLEYKLFPEVFGTQIKHKVEPIQKQEMLMVSIGTAITGGTIGQVTEKTLTIDLKVPTIPFEKEKVGIARKVEGHWRLIGHGEIQA